MHRSVTRALLGVFLILITVLAAGCDNLPFELPAFRPTATPALPATPEATPPATVLPEGPYAPVVVEHLPKTGEMVPLATDIVVRFDQSMDQSSVEDSLLVSPDVEGDLIWQDEKTILLRPKALASATRYHVSVGPEAQSLAGLTLATELSFAFSTVPPITVTRVNPNNGGVDMRTDTPVLIAFNQPVVSLNCTGQIAKADCPVLPLAFSPAALGDGLWVNPSLYRYTPLSGWAAGITYAVTLGEGFKSVTGDLVGSYSWSFGTASPAIQTVQPGSGQENVPLNAGIRVTFSTPMDEEITASVFSLKSVDGVVVPGLVTWEDAGAVLVFTPTQPLTLSARYNVRVGERARAVSSAPLRNPRAWSFETVSAPGVMGFVPADGARLAAVYEPVRIFFEGLIDSDTLPDHVRIEPPPAELYQYFNEKTNTYHLSWDKKPRTEYCVSTLPGVADIYGNLLAEERTTCFTTGDMESFVAPVTAFAAATLDAVEAPQFYFLVRNQDELALTLFSLAEEEFVHGGSRSGSTVLREWGESFNAPANETTIASVSLTRRGGPLDPGYYRLEWDTRWGRQGIDLAVVNYHITLKLAEEEALAWVTDLRSGIPISRTAVRLVDQEGLLIAAGTTDNDGLARIPISPRENLWQNVAAVVGVPGAPGFGVAMINWQSDATPLAFGIGLDSGPFSQLEMAVYTDRPVYRPGQSVYFRGVVRQKKEDGYALPSRSTVVMLTLQDSMSNVVYSDTLPLSELGSLDGFVQLPSTALLGQYRLEIATLDGVSLPDWGADFLVAAYRKPEFETMVTLDYAGVLQGETVRALVQSTYLFGGPVGRASLSWTVRSEPVAWGSQQVGGDAMEFVGGVSKVIASGIGKTDASGQFLIELPTQLDLLDARYSATPQRWTLEATVIDAGGSSVSGRGEILVHPARFYLDVHPERLVSQPGDKVAVTVSSSDWVMLPVADREVTLTLSARAWYQLPTGTSLTSAEWVYSDTAVSTITVATDNTGRAVAEFTPEVGGVYVLAAEALDAGGALVRAESLIWVGGGDSVLWPTTSGRVTPVADAVEYQVGDTANILLPTPFDGVYQVLMTVECDGVLDVRLFTFDIPNPTIELPIRDTYAPNIYVSFVLIHGIDERHPAPEVRSGYVALSVTLAEQVLTVDLIPDKPIYAPGETMSLLVRTLDAKGSPVDAEVGLSVVDKSVLALRRSSAPSLIEAFYGHHPLRIAFGDSLSVLLNRLERYAGELAAGAIRQSDLYSPEFPGKDSEESAAAGTSLREEFPDTALWETRLRTGETGEVQVTLELPDSLTTWVVDVQAVTADTLVGENRTEVRATKPLAVRPVTPQFFVGGDRVQIAAMVHNNTDSDLNVTVSVDAGSATVEDSAERMVAVSASGSMQVVWTLVVPQSGVQFIPLTFSAQGGGYQDAVRATSEKDERGIPVYRYVIPDVLGVSGILREAGRRVDAVVIPATAGDAGTLDIRVDVVLSTVLSDSLAFLERCPYDTNDVLVARFLPGLAVYQAFQSTGVETSTLEGRLRLLVADSRDRLYLRQNADGGWGWREDASTLHLTAYVTLGLVRAQHAGFAVRADVLERALAYIYAALETDLQGETRSSQDAFALYVLSEAKSAWPTGAGSTLYTVRDRLDPAGRVYLALALGTVDPSDPRLKSLFDSLRNGAELTATGAHWEVVDPALWSTKTQVTAAVVDAMARFAPDDPILPQALRWLMAARRAGHWETEYETSWAVMALADFMEVSGEAQADYTWGLALNGASLYEGVADAQVWQFQESLQPDSLIPLQRDLANLLEISRTEGTGRLYYASDLALSVPAAQLASESRGIGVRREYCAVRNVSADPALCVPVQQVHVGDLVEVRLTLVVPQTRAFVLLTDPYPVGFAPINKVFSTEAQTPRAGDLALLRPAAFASWWRSPFDRRELYDDYAAFFTTELESGTYQVTYTLRAAIPGAYQALPATIREMYFPEVWGRSSGTLLYVLPPES
ncbi:MAG: Ig-like domain-containing protein [Anaerolineae bacterium]|nr:Ig-like domain-containing protein [Anaerolineae bacterium]